MDREERFNCYSHLVALILAVVGLAVLVVSAVRSGNPWKIVTFSIYGTSLALMYAFSTLYHGLEGKVKKTLRKLDHIAIYLLIAGTYTPFTLVSMDGGGWGWTLFGIVWGLAVIGILLDVLHSRGARPFQIAIYLIMGWLIVISWPRLVEVLPATAIGLLAAGGGFYTVGIIFYGMDEKFRHAHEIWHLFVLAGSISHYLAVFLYIA